MSKEQKKTVLEEKMEAEAAREAAEQAEAVDTAPEAESAEADAASVEADLAAILAERDTMQDQMLRLRADFENYRKRMLRETERIRKTAAEALIGDLLPVIDHLDLALKHRDDSSAALAEGVEMVLKNFLDILGRHGVETIATEGQPFDPAIHDAVMQQPSEDVPEGHVVQEFQRGFRLNELVLRPAKVVVSTGQPANEA